MPARAGSPFTVPSAMAKSGLDAMTKSLAIEWGRYGINVNAICPGYISTELNEHHWDTEGGKKLIAMTPRKRLGQPEEIAEAVVWLCSDRASFVQGESLLVDGGAVAR